MDNNKSPQKGNYSSTLQPRDDLLTIDETVAIKILHKNSSLPTPTSTSPRLTQTLAPPVTIPSLAQPPRTPTIIADNGKRSQIISE